MIPIRAALVGALALGLTAAGIAAAPTSPVTAGQSLQYWEGTVTKVSDGDTIWVDLAGDGTSKSFEVRNGSIEATEMAHPRHGIPKNECHSVEATQRMKELVFAENRHVRLSAYNESSQGNGRLLRFVDVDTDPGPGTHWVDVQEVLLREGLVLWKTDQVEAAHNEDYHRVAQEAMRRGTGIYEPDHRVGTCQTGPLQAQPLVVTINYNGFDARKGNLINREWVKIQNKGEKNVPLGKWTIRDGSHRHYFRFPSGAVVKAGSSVRLRAGSGKATKTTFYWKRATNPYRDPVKGLAFPGRAAYLLDPDGDIRAFADYPCMSECTDALRGQLEISKVNYAAPGADVSNPNGEYVDIKSTGGTINLSGYIFERHLYNVILPGGTILRPGDVLRVKMGAGSHDLKGPNLVVHVGADHGILTDAGQVVLVRTWDAIRLDCRAWGNRSC